MEPLSTDILETSVRSLGFPLASLLHSYYPSHFILFLIPLASLLHSSYPSYFLLFFMLFKMAPNPRRLPWFFLQCHSLSVLSPCVSSQNFLHVSFLTKNLCQIVGLQKWILPYEQRIPWVSIFKLWSLVISHQVEKLVTLQLIHEGPGPMAECVGLTNQCAGPFVGILLVLNISNLQILHYEDTAMQYLWESSKYLYLL